MTDANAHVAEMEAQMDELRAAAREYRPAPDLHTIDAEEVIDPQDIEVEVTEEPAPEEPAGPTTEELLAEIRDLLKEQK